MKLTNEQIYLYSKKLQKAFDDEKRYFPVRINFFIQKNKQLLEKESDEIEQNRFEIIKKFGILNEDDENQTYQIPKEEIEKTNKELNDLLKIEQDLNIYTLFLEDIEDLEFTPAQMDALLFMIEEEDEEDDD